MPITNDECAAKVRDAQQVVYAIIKAIEERDGVHGGNDQALLDATMSIDDALSALMAAEDSLKGAASPKN